MADVAALRALIEQERSRFGVPGVAVAVVADGEVLLCEGFGTRDLDSGAPVTADTHFPIASDTKAFTAALLCQLADEGEVDLDTPVRDVVPWFAMHDPHATALVTPRDLLSHRTGLPRHDFVWYGETQHTLESVARSLRHLPLSRPVRQTWQYNNLCYNTAGYLTEVLTGSDWGTALRERLLEPLGMKASVLSHTDEVVTEKALPYTLTEDGLELQVLPAADRLSPAGGLVSTASDMSHWLQARLGLRTDVLSTEALAQLHGPAMIGGVGLAAFDERQPMGYALGTQVEAYRGTRIVRHGGNLVGFSSDVCVVPSSGVGIVVLTNLHGTSLRDALPLMIIDRLLGLEPVEWGERYHELMTAMVQGRRDALRERTSAAGGAAPSRPLQDFAGTYSHPAYGELRVSVEGDRLVPDFHGLGERHRLEHRDHDVWDLVLTEFESAMPVVFEQARDGSVGGLTVGLEPTVDPIRFTRRRPAADPALVEALPGSYTMGPHTLVVRRRGDELLAKVPLLGTLLLESAGGNRFTSPTVPSVTLLAQQAADGSVERLTVNPVGVFVRSA